MHGGKGGAITRALHHDPEARRAGGNARGIGALAGLGPWPEGLPLMGGPVPLAMRARLFEAWHNRALDGETYREVLTRCRQAVTEGL